MARMILLVFSLYSAFVSGSAQNQATCTGLDRLAQNANTDLLSNCAKDSGCTQVTCQVAGTLGIYLASVVFTLDPCGTPPGVRMQLLSTSGEAVVDQIITSPTVITRSVSIATVTITVFVNSTANSIGISVDPVSINAGFFGSSDYLISFTSIPLDLSTCQSATTTALEESTVTAAVPLQTTETCLDLEQLARNANPNYLSNCARDSACTQVTCQGSGVLSGQIDLATIALSPCGVPPGIVVNLVRSGTAVVNQLITATIMITYDAGVATVNINVFINSTTNTIGILIDPITIMSFLGTTNDYLVSFTSVQLDKSSCAQTTESATTDSNQETPTTTMASVRNTDSETGDTTTATSAPTEPTASSLDTCTGLEQLASNANPELVSNCARDDRCTQVTCEAAGVISSQLDSMTITLELCETPPGVTIELLKDESAIINQLITSPTNITQSLGFATVEAYVFVNSTGNTIGIAVDPVRISASIGSRSDTLISFTLVPFNMPQCDDESTTVQSSNAALSVMLSFELFLLTLAVLFINAGHT